MKRKLIFTLSLVFLTCISGYANLYINEVNSTGKWIEIYNSGNSEVDLSGYTVIRYNNDGTAKSATIPAVTLLFPDRFLVIYEGPASGGTSSPPVDGAIDCMSFGISTDKFLSAELKNVQDIRVDIFDIGDPQTVIVSGGKSWARAADGATTIAALDPTPGESNNSEPSFSDLKIYINEVNSTGKWIEIYNDEDRSIPAGRYTVTRYNNDGAAGIAAIPPGRSIPSKGFLVLYQGDVVDSPAGGAIDCLPYGISTDKFIRAILRDDENRIVNTFDIGDPQTVRVFGGKSWARETDGDETIVALDPTPGLSNTTILPRSELKIYVNEVNSTGKWIEFYNDEEFAVNLEGYTVARHNYDGSSVVTLPAGSTIAPKGFLVIYQGPANGTENPSPVDGAIDCQPFGISSDRFAGVVLKDVQGLIVDNTFDIGYPQTVTVIDGKSWARETDGAANIAALDPTPGLRNDGLTNLLSKPSENVLAYVHAGMLILPEKTSYIQLYGVSGMLVLSQNAIATSVDLTNLPKGFYVVELTVSGVSYTQKIVLY